MDVPLADAREDAYVDGAAQESNTLSMKMKAGRIR
jgi:hypothetical protein